MKIPTVAVTAFLLFASFGLVSAKPVAVTAKILDRAEDGTALFDQFVYPQVELEPGESGSLHIGKDFRYQIWNKDLEGHQAVGQVFEDRKIGLSLKLKVAEAEEKIAYSGRVETTLVNGVSDSGSSLSSTTAIFFGKVENDGVVELEIVDSTGRKEVVLLHFVRSVGSK